MVSFKMHQLTLRSAEDVHEVFQLLGYDIYDPEPFEGDDLDQLELDDAEREVVKRAYVVARRDNHTVYLYEVNDLRQIRLRGLAWHALQRGTATLVVTTPTEQGKYHEVLFVDPRFVGKANKTNVRVNKLKVITDDPTRHDLDTLNAIHAHRRTGQQVYDAQAEAFNVTTITKKFYDEYRRHYEHARAVIRQYNPGIREFQNSDQTDKLHAFTQRLLGRLMFLYFLQRKGWLGERQKFLTDKYNETMRLHVHELHGDGETFHYYSEVLEPLFFQTMNTQRPGNITQWTGIRIPYLNGGLFDENRDPAGPIIIPDKLFDPTIPEGLLAFFNRYNFTIEDDTPLEQDVSVDPEMLGKVFENMLEERDRGQSGSFYTPRTIVAYMCQEALVGYLEESASVSRETTRAQFDPDSEVRYTSEEAERVNTALDTLTVLDPAVGSGSFLIGMLTEIIRLRKTCYAVLHEGQDAPSSVLADWKEAIIRDTLYGVDIKPEAIEIAQLRLWLALVVDQTLEQARPLPNLDYKLMAGNSLIETIDGEPILGDSARAMMGAEVIPVQPTLMGMFETEAERFKLDELRKKFFRAKPEERKKLRTDITSQERRIVSTSLREKAEALQQSITELGKLSARQNGKLKPSDERKLKTAVEKLAQLTKLQGDMDKPDYVPPFFLYRLHFSEVFEHKGGFDIVVANPPYVRGELLGDQKPELKLSYPDVYVGTADLYVYFFARAYGLLSSNGQLSFITSNKYLRASYGKGLRKFLSEKVQLNTIIDFGDLPVFDATAYPCIVIGDKAKKPHTIKAAHILDTADLEDLVSVMDRDAIILQQTDLTEKEWSISTEAVSTLIVKIGVHERLQNYCKDRFFVGLKTGYNTAFVIDEATYNSLISEDERTLAFIRHWLRGKDIDRWRATLPPLWIIYVPWNFDIEEYPVIKSHLLPYKDALEARPEVRDGRHAWYSFSRYAPNYVSSFSQRKIVYPDIAARPTFAIDDESAYPDMTAFVIPDDDIYLLGILNSSVCEFFIKQISSTIRGGYIRLKNQYVSQIPIPNAPNVLRDKITKLAQRCLDAAKDAPDTLLTLEAELNQLVYQAYGLDADDIAVIEGYLAGKNASIDSVTVESAEPE